MVERDADGNLPPLEEKDYLPEALIIFACITGPILFIFICVTWYCRCQRRKRREQEKISKMNQMRTTGRTETEVPMATSGRDTARSENEKAVM